MEPLKDAEPSCSVAFFRVHYDGKMWAIVLGLIGGWHPTSLGFGLACLINDLKLAS